MLYKQTVLMTGITFLAVTGVALRLQQLYFMTAVLGFVTLGFYVLARLAAWGLELRRGPAHKIYEGEWCGLTVTVTNRSRLPKIFLTVRDALPQWVEPLEGAALMIPTLFPRAAVELTYRVRGVKRGAYQLGPITVSATDPLGVFRIERRFEQPQELIVYPAPVRVAPEMLTGAISFGGAATEQLSAAGAGMEFYGIRDYQPGDALRRIHWPSTARLGHFHVVEFEEMLGADLVIVLDLRRSAQAGSGKGSTAEVAIKAAASLMAYAVENAAGAVVVGQDGRRSYRASARRPEELSSVFEALARMEADGDTGLGQVMAMANELAAGTTIVLLTAAPEQGAVEGVTDWVVRQAQVVAVLFDADSYGARHGEDVYQVGRRLKAVGARVEIMRKGDELEGVLGHAMNDAA